eukprot:scaffold7566_cov106-Skeletonema_dohrnii-CCMP3373.AAC.3
MELCWRLNDNCVIIRWLACKHLHISSLDNENVVALSCITTAVWAGSGIFGASGWHHQRHQTYADNRKQKQQQKQSSLRYHFCCCRCVAIRSSAIGRIY